MRMGTTTLLAGVMAVFCLAAAGGAAKPRAGQTFNSEIERSRLSRIRGSVVENKDGETLGHLKDFVFETGTGEIKYAVVSVRGFLGARSTRKIVPVAVLSSATTKKRTLALDVDLRRWKKAPQFRRSELATLNEPRREREISRYYGNPTPESGLPHVAPQGGTRPLLAATGRDSGVRERQARTPGSFQLAGELVGHDVINRQSQTLGRLSDLLIDLAGNKPALGIISAAQPSRKEQKFAAPLRMFSITGTGALAIDATPATFAQAQPFSEGAWQSLAAHEATIYHYVE